MLACEHVHMLCATVDRARIHAIRYRYAIAIETAADVDARARMHGPGVLAAFRNFSTAVHV